MEKKIRGIKSSLKQLYGAEPGKADIQWRRYQELVAWHKQCFKSADLSFFSAPGRTEIGGNHTDHNQGRVLAAAVNPDSVAAVSPADRPVITVYSQGYAKPFIVSLNNLEADPAEQGTTFALIRGIAARFKKLNYRIGGFNACINSDVLPGSGLSSSASIEVLMAKIFGSFYNRDQIVAEELAKIGQFAENEYFGKPCGLMDQMACAVGGIIAVDFDDPQKPLVKKVAFDFSAQKYSLLVADSGTGHKNLTVEYALIPDEMKKVAAYFGKAVCREITWSDLIAALPGLRTAVTDRAILRAMHFISENQRVQDQVNALKKGAFKRFLSLVKASGDSSFKWLQNVYTPQTPQKQGIALALALTEKYIAEIGEGACRIHGGGFAGTILVFLPASAVPAYRQRMSAVFGPKSVVELKIRSEGVVRLC